MERVWNFSAGPTVLPVEVLEKAQKELLLYSDKGMSVMEMSHRSGMYLDIFNETERLLRELMDIPEHYKVLFLQGGATAQFSMVPLNLFRRKKADYVKTGEFAKKAIQEAQRYGEINVVASSEDKTFSYIPELKKEKFDPEADYFHITINNTIYGTRFTELPDTGAVPLVTDMSSSILSEVYDVNKFGLIYAGAQKNIGPAGLTIVILREDLLGHTQDIAPILYNYKVMADNDSMLNTPPTYAIYMAKLVFEWLRDLGGVAAIEVINKEKAALLYDYLDESKLFRSTVVPKDRSLMNVPFVTGEAETDAQFIKAAAAAGFVNLKGHRSVGGMRASIYNAMPKAGIEQLVAFMKQFETTTR